MAWRDNLRPASFRGVSFFVETTSGESGRRIVVHEYPKRDEPYAEDMGRRTRYFPFTAYVIGEDYFQKRDALIKACEDIGPGTLVHPYRGEINVVVESFKWSETNAEGRICRFDFTFIEAGQNKYPTTEPDNRSGLLSSIRDAKSASSQSFNDIYRWRDVPSFVVDSIAANVQDFAALLSGLRQGSFGAPVDIVTDFVEQSRRLYTNSGIVARSNTMAADIQQAVTLFRRSYTDPVMAQRDLRSLAEFEAKRSDLFYPTTNRRIQALDLDALTNLVREASITEQARLLLDIDFYSRQEALSARDTIINQIDMVTLRAGDRGDDHVYEAFQNLYAAVTKNLTARGASLAPLIAFQTGRALPSLVVAHRLYQKIDSELELVARNRTPHPGFMPVSLEVLAP